MADDGTASESELGAGFETHRAPSPLNPPPTQPNPQEASKKRKGGLGVIAGKKKIEKEKPSPPAPTSPGPPAGPKAEKAAEPAPSAKSKRPTKFGTIGGKAKRRAMDSSPQRQSMPASPEPLRYLQSPEAGERVSKVATAHDLSEKGKKSKTPPPAPEPAVVPETEDEKANRRREELKRELEAKSKAPSKKKRRF